MTRQRFFFITFLSSLIILSINLNSNQNEFNEDFYNYVKKGDSLYSSFKNQEAINYYTKAYNLINNDDYEILLKLARTYNDAGEDLKGTAQCEKYFEKSNKFSQKMLKLKPDRAESHIYYGISLGNIAFFKGGKDKVRMSEEIMKHAERAMQIDSTLIHPYIMIGVYYREISGLNFILNAFARTFYGKIPDVTYEDAIACFKKATQMYPNLITPKYQIAKTYEKEKEYERALEFYAEVVELNPIDHDDVRKKNVAFKKLKELKNKIAENR